MVGPGDEERQRSDVANVSVVSRTRACGVDAEVVVVDGSFNVPSNLLEHDTGVCSAT
jgi:hypothetical protein